MKLINKCNKIFEEVGPSIIVLSGFDTESLSKENKYFKFDLSNIDQIDLDEVYKTVRTTLIENLDSNDSYKWMTIEEYQLFKRHSNINDMKIVSLKNNLYDKQFPYNGLLSDVDKIYKNYYFDEENELSKEELKTLENVNTFYGKINYSKQRDVYYVTYPEFEQDVEEYYFYDQEDYKAKQEENLPENIYQVELSEDEIPFLDIVSDLSSNKKFDANIVFVTSGDSVINYNNYLSRINILSKITNKKFYFSTHSLQRKAIKNAQEYKSILNNIYGYDYFKHIAFYKNIDEKSSETIEISQMQIIDDIVNEAEKAMLGEDFRDIYITASTGAGKSLMFQIPALYLLDKYPLERPLTIVISPLIGLMNDQVSSMKRKGIKNSATINGNTLPFDKEKILENVANKEVDILYISPETLQSRSDIKTLISDRSIGAVIIDEAHIVTTWGKSFRSDYWYLGIYLTKLRKEYKFPIITFTATSIYGGKEDMYIDTRNSLNMISPISYFGKVRREEILMNVVSSEKTYNLEGNDYRKTKNVLALRHLVRASKNNEKSLLYFPTVRLLNEFGEFLKKNEPKLYEDTGRYFGNLQKEEKDEVLNQYQSGEIKFVLATKAFGMGIDIPDIKYVYHYAPTGNVVDYIQEIGRAARDRDKVTNRYGIAEIDFLHRDMNEVMRLYGMSSIRKQQILDVMAKIVQIYKKNNNRNMIISPEDFKHIFEDNNVHEDSLDNKVKTVLLMIEKDFESPNKLGYPPFVARPRNVFGNDLIFVSKDFEKKLLSSNLGKHVKKLYDIDGKYYSMVYELKLSEIWEKHYNKYSYPDFKRRLFTPEERDKLQHANLFSELTFASGVIVTPSNGYNDIRILQEYEETMKAFESFSNNYRISDKHFTVRDLGRHFKKSLKINDEFKAMTVAQSVINAAFEFSKINEIKFITDRSISSETQSRYKITQDVDLFKKFILNNIKNCLTPSMNFVQKEDSMITFHSRTKLGNKSEMDAKIATLGIGDVQKILSFKVIGGYNPQIYLRMNSIYPMERAIAEGDFYKNNILQDVQNKHYTSVEMLRYLFTKKFDVKSNGERIKKYTEWFWDVIEEYFMGKIPQEVEDNINRLRR